MKNEPRHLKRVFLFAVILGTILSFQSVPAASFALPAQAANNSSFFLNINETLAWEQGQNAYLLTPRFISNGRAAVAFNASGQFFALLLAPGVPQKIDVNEDQKADVVLALVNISENRVELKMSLAEQENGTTKSALLWIIIGALIVIICVIGFFLIRKSRSNTSVSQPDQTMNDQSPSSKNPSGF